MKIATVLGTRPEIIKLSPLLPLLNEHFEHVVIHTGQHYSYEMDGVFFKELKLRTPHYNLGVGSGSQAHQTSMILMKLEKVLQEEKPDIVLVQGDTNTTLAGALCAAKLQIPVAHVEAGCRSFNREMPEEINRILTDHISTLLFASDEEDVQNLLNEGILKERVYLTGRTSSIACRRNLKLAQTSTVLQRNSLETGRFIVATIHRAENTNHPKRLRELMDSLNEVASEMMVVIPLHPRTKQLFKEHQMTPGKNVRIIEPLGYLDFLKLASEAYLLMSDSGGIQEEAVELNVPCLVLRNETEHRAFIKAGKNILVGTQKEGIVKKSLELIRDGERVRTIKSIPFATHHDAHLKIFQVLKDFHAHFLRESA